MRELKNLHVVIAEDDLDDGQIVCESFSKHPSFGKVSWVKNGKLLLDFLKTNEKPDLILTDINMPIINGIEVLEAVFKDLELCKIPIFTYSSTNNPIYEAKCKELGSHGFLIKPYNLFDFDEIPREIIFILERAQQEGFSAFIQPGN